MNFGGYALNTAWRSTSDMFGIKLQDHTFNCGTLAGFVGLNSMVTEGALARPSDLLWNAGGVIGHLTLMCSGRYYFVVPGSAIERGASSVATQ